MKFKKLDEGVLFDDKLKSYRLDLFELGKENILLVKGLSGGGKSTLTKKLVDKYDAEIIELDNLDFLFFDFYSNSDIYTNDQILAQFIISNKINLTDYDWTSGEDMVKLFDIYMTWLIKYCHRHNNQRFIINGIQLSDGTIDKNIIKDLPYIKLGTSVVKSSIRATKRNLSTPDYNPGKIHEFKNIAKQNYKQYKNDKEN